MGRGVKKELAAAAAAAAAAEGEYKGLKRHTSKHIRSNV